MIAIDYNYSKNEEKISQKFKNILDLPKAMQVFAKTIASDLVPTKPFKPFSKLFYTDFTLPYYYRKPRRCIQLVENNN